MTPATGAGRSLRGTMTTSQAALVRIGEPEIRPNEGRIVSREELYRLAWGRPLRRGDRSCDVYVHKLRAKLERALPQHRFIHTHVGFGYRLDPGP